MRTGIICICVTGLVLMSGCSGLRIPQPLKVDDADWFAFGKNHERINATSEILSPPLAVAWEYDISSGMGSGSPIVIDSTVIVTNLRGELYAMNARTGKRFGWANLGEAVQGSPVIDQNVAYVATTNARYSMIAYDLIEGTTVWKKSYGDIESTPTMFANKIFFGNTSGIFFCIDKATGDQEWRFRLPENSKRKGIRSSPAISDSLVMFGAEDGNVYALDIRFSTPRWTVNTGSPVFAAPAVYEGTLFCGNKDGSLFAIDVKSGKERWRFDAGSSIYATPSFSNNRVLIGTVGGRLHCLNASTGSIIWSNDLKSVINSSAVVSGNVAYLGTLKKELLAIKLEDGSVAWKQTLRGRVKTSPAIAHGQLYVASDDKVIIAFKPANLSETVEEKRK